MAKISKQQYQLMLEYYYDTIINLNEIRIMENSNGDDVLYFQLKHLDARELMHNLAKELRREKNLCIEIRGKEQYLINRETKEVVSDGFQIGVFTIINYLEKLKEKEIELNEHLDSYDSMVDDNQVEEEIEFSLD